MVIITNNFKRKAQPMTEKIVKVLIGDDSLEIGVKLASHLNSTGIYAIAIRKDMDILLDAIVRHSPDIFISDLTLQSSDAFALMGKLKELKISPPKFILYTNICNNFIKRQIIQNGAAYCFTLPLDFEKVTKAVHNLIAQTKCPPDEDIEVAVTSILHKLGIPPHIKGYHYLRTAVINSLSDHSLLDCITKRLYPSVAETYNTTPSRVERSIRHAIECCWQRGSCENLYKFFGYDPAQYTGKPTNSELISLISDKLRLKYKL